MSLFSHKSQGSEEHVEIIQPIYFLRIEPIKTRICRPEEEVKRSPWARSFRTDFCQVLRRFVGPRLVPPESKGYPSTTAEGPIVAQAPPRIPPVYWIDFEDACRVDRLAPLRIKLATLFLANFALVLGQRPWHSDPERLELPLLPSAAAEPTSLGATVRVLPARAAVERSRPARARGVGVGGRLARGAQGLAALLLSGLAPSHVRGSLVTFGLGPHVLRIVIDIEAIRRQRGSAV
jgi:hypothetical protein